MMTIPKGAHVRVYRTDRGDPPRRQAALDGILVHPFTVDDDGMFRSGVTVLVDGREVYEYNYLDRVELREGEPRRDWMTIAQEGGQLFEQRERIELMIERLKWQEHPLPDKLPMSPGLAIKKIISEFTVPKVSAVALSDDDLIIPDGDDGERAYLAMYGIEGNYRNGRVRLYVIDFGSHLNVAAADVYEPVTA